MSLFEFDGFPRARAFLGVTAQPCDGIHVEYIFEMNNLNKVAGITCRSRFLRLVTPFIQKLEDKSIRPVQFSSQ